MFIVKTIKPDYLKINKTKNSEISVDERVAMTSNLLQYP